MTYAKRATPIDIADALAATLEQHGLGGEGGVIADVTPSLLSAGQAVTLEDGRPVWLSCIVFDRPETPQVDFLTVAIACDMDGVPWAKGNGQTVSVVFWHGLWPDLLASLSIGVTRKALMMVALGEPQPQVPIIPPEIGGPTHRDAIPLNDADARSIRSAITAASEIAAPLEDVL